VGVEEKKAFRQVNKKGFEPRRIKTTTTEEGGKKKGRGGRLHDGRCHPKKEKKSMPQKTEGKGS